jgi:hypothetical protein
MSEPWSCAEEKRVHENTMALLAEVLGGRPVTSVGQLTQQEPEPQALIAVPTDPEEKSALDEAMGFLRDMLRGGSVWSIQVKKGARDAGISEITLKREIAALGARSEKEADGSWTWLLAEAKGIEKGQSPEDELLDPLDPFPITEPLSAGQKDQGDQEAQRDQARRDEHLAFTDNGPRPQRRCSMTCQADAGCARSTQAKMASKPRWRPRHRVGKSSREE